MQGIIDLIASGDPLTIVIVIVLLLATGGVGTAIVQGYAASKRGLKGDALVKEQNGIEGLTNLGTLQGGFITTLQKQITDQQTQIEELKQDYTVQLKTLRDELRDEIAYSNKLIQTLSENTVPIPPRPKR